MGSGAFLHDHEGRVGWHRYAAIALLAMAMELLSSMRDVPQVLHGGLIDPDSFMRLVRIEQGMRLGHLVNSVQRDDSGAPLVIEWSRLFDGVIVMLAAPIAPWLGWHRALLIAGVATGPLSAGLLGAALCFAVAPVCGAAYLWTIPLIGLLLPGIRGFDGLGIIHYHIAQVVLVALTAGFAVRAGEARAGPAWGCGIAGGMALWLMPETMPFVLLCFVGLGYVWLFRPIGPAIARLGCGFAAMVVLALWVDPPHRGVWIPEIDRLSIVYAALGVAVAIAGLWLAALDQSGVAGWRRGLFGSAGAVVSFVVWLARYPRVALGPYGVIPAHDLRAFFGHMTETQPVHGGAEAAMLLGPGLLAMLYWLHRAGRAGSDRIAGGVWLIVGVGNALSLGLTARFVIFQQYPAGFAACALPIILSDVSRRWAARPLRAACARIGAIALLLPLPYTPSLALASMTKPVAPPPRCDMRHIAPFLRPAAGAIVLTPVQDVPELLYRTRIIAVGSLYQHGIDGYLRARRAWRAPAGPREPEAVMATKATFVLFCGGGKRNKSAPSSSVEARLRQDRPPPWLSPIGEDGANGFRLYRVNAEGAPALIRSDGHT